MMYLLLLNKKEVKNLKNSLQMIQNKLYKLKTKRKIKNIKKFLLKMVEKYTCTKKNIIIQKINVKQRIKYSLKTQIYFCANFK